jgi:hypothetical protein
MYYEVSNEREQPETGKKVIDSFTTSSKLNRTSTSDFKKAGQFTSAKT